MLITLDTGLKPVSDRGKANMNNAAKEGNRLKLKENVIPNAMRANRGEGHIWTKKDRTQYRWPILVGEGGATIFYRCPGPLSCICYWSLPVWEGKEGKRGLGKSRSFLSRHLAGGIEHVKRGAAVFKVLKTGRRGR